MKDTKWKTLNERRYKSKTLQIIEAMKDAMKDALMKDAIIDAK